MRKILVLLAVLGLACNSAWADTAINAQAFPDAKFMEFVRTLDSNNDGTLQDTEISAVTTINVTSRDISSLEGIKTFTALKVLLCPSNNITALDLSGLTQLEEIACDYNPLANLDLTGCVSLRTLFCTNTRLQSLGLSYAANLRELYCYVSDINVLDLSSNSALVSLDCQENKLNAIDLSHNPALEYVDVGGNNITSLNLSANPNIKALVCRDINLSANGLDLSAQKDLISLWCWNCGLTSLDLSAQSSLAELICRDNPINGTLNISSFVDYANIGDWVMQKDNVSILTALDADGNSLQFSGFDDASVSPALAKYTYDTGLDNVKLTVTAATPEARDLASCSNGIFKGATDDNITVWKGIPYAKQPVDSLRWKAPQAPEDSDEVHDALNFAPTPIQHESLTNPTAIMPRGEECLALNVWNNGTSDTLKPVMVWVHGGSFNSGGTANPDYSGQHFIEAHDDVILVSVGYRVGMMGFIDFANSGLAGGEDFPDSGNLGLLDILESVRWVKKNIRAFGGDPHNITLFGNSSGSASIALIMSMPESAGLFQKAITESGAVSMTSGVDDCKPLTQALIQATGATSMSDLMALSSSELLTLADNLKALTNFPERDGVHLAANPYEAFALNSPNFQIMAGTMADEVNYWALGLGAEQFAQFVPAAFYQIVEGISAVNSEDGKIPETFVAQYMAEHEGATEIEAMSQFVNDLMFRVPTLTELENFAGNKYLYYWTYPSGIPGLGACHTLEIPYVLNFPSVFIPFLFDKDFAADVQELWVNFAKSGTPSASWPSYDTTTRATMIIDEGFNVSNGHLAERFALVGPLMKYGISGQTLINATNGQTEQEGDSGSQDTEQEGDSQPQDTEPETEPQGDSDSQPTNDPGSSGGGCNAGLAAYALSVVMLFAFRKK